MTVFTDKVQKYNSRLMTDLGLTEVQACGIWGNLGTETGGFTALQEKRPTVAGSRGGYGWMQWTGPRRRKYEAWCVTNRLSPSDDDANYQYLVYETKTDEAKSLSQLKKTSTIEAATQTFMAQNLRPGTPNLANRINFAKQAQNALVSKSKVNTQVVVATGTVAAGTAAATQADFSTWMWMHDHWMITTVAVAAVVGLIIWVIHKYKETHKQDILVELPATKTRKAKKND